MSEQACFFEKKLSQVMHRMTITDATTLTECDNGKEPTIEERSPVLLRKVNAQQVQRGDF